MTNFHIIGDSPVRVDALDKVTGRAMFTADFKEPRMLYLKLVRSPYPHARILSIDTSKAEKLAGVRGIVRPEDAPKKRVGTLQKKGYPAGILPVTDPKERSWYTVRIGDYPSRDVARQHAEAFTSREKMESAVRPYGKL